MSFCFLVYDTDVCNGNLNYKTLLEFQRCFVFVLHLKWCRDNYYYLPGENYPQFFTFQNKQKDADFPYCVLIYCIIFPQLLVLILRLLGGSNVRRRRTLLSLLCLFFQLPIPPVIIFSGYLYSASSSQLPTQHG